MTPTLLIDSSHPDWTAVVVHLRTAFDVREGTVKARPRDPHDLAEARDPGRPVRYEADPHPHRPVTPPEQLQADESAPLGRRHRSVEADVTTAGCPPYV